MAEDTTAPLTDEEIMSQIPDEEITKQLDDLQSTPPDTGEVVDPESGATIVPVTQGEDSAPDGMTLQGAVSHVNDQTGDAINKAYDWLENLGDKHSQVKYEKPVDGETPLEGAGRMARNTWLSVTQDPYGALVNTTKSATQIGHNILQEGVSLVELSTKLSPLTRLVMTGKAIVDTAKAGEFRDPIKALSQGVQGRLDKATFSQDLKVPQLRADLQPNYEGHELVDEMGTFLTTAIILPSSKITGLGKVGGFLVNSVVEGASAQAAVSIGQGKDATGMLKDQVFNAGANVALGGAGHLLKKGFGSAGKYFGKGTMEALQKGEEAAIRLQNRFVSEISDDQFTKDIVTLGTAAKILSGANTRAEIMEGPQGQETLDWLRSAAKYGRRTYDPSTEEAAAIEKGLLEGFDTLNDGELGAVDQWLTRASSPPFKAGGEASRRTAESQAELVKITKFVETRAQVDVEAALSYRPKGMYEPDVYEKHFPDSAIQKEVGAPEAATSQPTKYTVRLFRGESATTHNTHGSGEPTFWTPDKSRAEDYNVGGGNLLEEEVTFNNLLEAKTWMEAKEKLGLPKSASMDDLIRAATEKGHDGVTFRSNGHQEYIRLGKRPTKPGSANVTPDEKAAAGLDDILPSDAEPLPKFEISDKDVDAITTAITTKDTLEGSDAAKILEQYLNPKVYRGHEDLVTVLSTLSDKIVAKVKASPFPMKDFRETVANHIAYLNSADPNGNLGDQLLQVAANNKDAMAKVLAAKVMLEGLSKGSIRELNKISKESLESGILTPAEQSAMRNFMFYRDAFASLYGPHKIAMRSASDLLRSYGRRSVMAQVEKVSRLGDDLNSVLGATDAELSITKDTPLLDALKKKTEPKASSTKKELSDDARMIAYLAKDAVEKQRNTNIMFALRDKAVSLWVNGLLSHWMTHAINITGTALNVARKPVDLFFGGERDLAWKIFVNQAYMLKPGIEAGIANFIKKGDGLGGTSLIGDSLSEEQKSLLEALAPSGITAENPALALVRKTAAVADRVTGIPGDAMKAEDEVFKYITAAGNISARLMQNTPGLSGEAARAEAAKLLQVVMKKVEDLTEEDLQYLSSNYAVVNEAIQAAHKATFTSPIHKDEGGVDTFLGFPAQMIRQAKNSNNIFVSTLAQTVFPFVGTPTNILQQAYDSTLLRALDPRFYQSLARGGRDAAEARGAMITGTGMMLGFISMAANGAITGSGPLNVEARQNLKNTGWQPNSFTWKDADGKQHYLNLSRIEPFGTLLSLSADFYEAGSHMTRGELEEVAPILAATFINTLSNKRMLKGLVDLNTFMDRAPNDPAALEAMIGSISSSAVPNFLRMFDRDPNVRLIRNRVDAAKAKIPGMSEDLPLSYDALGRPRIEHAFGLYSQVKDEALNSLIQEDIAAGGVGLGVLNNKTASGDDLTMYINPKTGKTAYQEVATVLSTMLDKYGIRDSKGNLVESTLEEYLTWADRHPQGDLSIFPHPDPNKPGVGMQYDDKSDKNVSSRMMAIQRILNKARTRAIGYVMETQGAHLINQSTGKSLYASHLKEKLGRSLMEPVELEYYRGEVGRLEEEKRAAEDAVVPEEPTVDSPSAVQDAQDRSDQIDAMTEGN